MMDGLRGCYEWLLARSVMAEEVGSRRRVMGGDARVMNSQEVVFEWK